MRRSALLIIALLCMVACGDSPGPAPNPPATAPVTPTRPGWAGELAVSPPPPSADSARAATVAFYTWYLGFAASNDPAQDPLANRLYAESGYLSSALIEAIDRFLISQEDQGFPTIDPLLCAPASPAAFTIAGQFQNGETTQVLVRTDLPRHGFTVHLRPTDAGWQIVDITCAAAPDGVATAFYVWYLGQESPPATTGAYAQSDYLSLAMIERARQQLDANGIDPFTLANEAPTAFQIELQGSADSLVLVEQFASRPEQRLRLRFVQVGSDWVIDGVESES